MAVRRNTIWNTVAREKERVCESRHFYACIHTAPRCIPTTRLERARVPSFLCLRRRGWPCASVSAASRPCTYVTASTGPDTLDKYLHMGLRGNFLKTQLPPHDQPRTPTSYLVPHCCRSRTLLPKEGKNFVMSRRHAVSYRQCGTVTTDVEGIGREPKRRRNDDVYVVCVIRREKNASSRWNGRNSSECVVSKFFFFFLESGEKRFF